MKRFYIGSLISVLTLLILELVLRHFVGESTTSYYNTPQTVEVAGRGLGLLPNILLGLGLVLFWFLFGGVNIVNEWARRPVMRLGRYTGEVGPGFCWINPAICWTLSDIFVIDRVSSVKIDNVQTKDNVPLSFLIVLTTRVNDVRKVVVEVSDYRSAIAERAMAAANSTIRAHDLSDILGHGLSFSEQILKELQVKIAPWGIETKAVEVKDFGIVDEEIEKAIAMKARAQKEAEAELTRAEMQQKIAEKLNEAAKTFDNEGWKLKSLEVLLELCKSANNNTILLPTELGSLAKIAGQMGIGM